MRVFFDTSVLVAASALSHPHHVPAFEAFRRVTTGADEGYIGVHSIAEAFAALTRLPVLPRVHPSEATSIIRDNILKHCTLVPAGKTEYLAALTVMQVRGLSGAKIYDALLLACAARSSAERIYTFNLSDFRALASDDQLNRICAP